MGSMIKIGLMVLVAVALINVCQVSPVHAEGGFAAIGERVGTQTEGVATGVKKIGFLVGIAFTLLGVVGFTTMKKTNIPASVPSIAVLVGIVLLSIFAFISAGSETLFGNDAATGIEELGID